MGNSQFERDFNDQSALKRPGRLDFRTLNNTDDAGDGYPGVQKTIRNILAYTPVLPGESIQDKIDELATRGGGGIYLLHGTHGAVDSFPLTISDANVSIVIIGGGDGCIINTGGDYTVFNITATSFAMFKDFKIDASDITTDTTTIITVNESSDNKVIIDNVNILGDAGYLGYGVTLTSDNIIVRNCEISYLQRGINISGSYNKVENCNIHNLSATQVAVDTAGVHIYGVNITGSNNVILNNKITTLIGGEGGDASASDGGSGGDAIGILIGATYTKVVENYMDNITGGRGGDALGGSGPTGGNGGYATGIKVNSVNYQKISENTSINISGGRSGDFWASGATVNAGDSSGIYVYTSSFCNIANNIITDVISGGTSADITGTNPTQMGYAHGIHLEDSNKNIINNNVIEDVRNGVYVDGTYSANYGILLDNSDDNVVSDNLIDNITGYTTFHYALNITNGSDYNIWDGNSYRGEGDGGVPNSNDVMGDNMV